MPGALTPEQVYGRTPVAPEGWEFTGEWVDMTSHAPVGTKYLARAGSVETPDATLGGNGVYRLALRRKRGMFRTGKDNSGYSATGCFHSTLYPDGTLSNPNIFATVGHAVIARNKVHELLENLQDEFYG